MNKIIKECNEGSVVGTKYKLLGKISQGSFGEIYKAINIETNQILAVKIVIFSL